MGDLSDLWSAGLLLVSLVGASAVSHWALPYLPERHRSRDTLDMVRLVSSLLVTFSALVLGLLTASVNTAFFNTGNDMNALAGTIRQADSCLHAYGPDASPLRAALRQYVSGVIASTWPEDAAPPGDYPKVGASSASFESPTLGGILERVQLGILRLDPADGFHQHVQALCSEELSRVLDQRWKLIGEAHSSISVPFYRVMIFMLIAVFACFGLNAPRNSLSWVTVTLAALTIGASVFVVLELDGPLDGLIKVSSGSMWTVLADLDR